MSRLCLFAHLRSLGHINSVGLPDLLRYSNTNSHFQKMWLNPLCFCRISSAITKSHPLRSDVFKSDLDKNLPNIQDIQAALLKLRQICVIGNKTLTP